MSVIFVWKSKECGIDVCVNTRNKNFGEAMVEAFGPDKADVIYDCAGNNITMGQAIKYARKGSVIVLVAVLREWLRSIWQLQMIMSLISRAQ